MVLNRTVTKVWRDFVVRNVATYYRLYAYFQVLKNSIYNYAKLPFTLLNLRIQNLYWNKNTME